MIASGDFAFGPAPSGGVRRVEMGEYDRCGPPIRLDGCAVNLYAPCASETARDGAEVERSIAYVTATMAADESRLTIEGLDETATTIYAAELTLRPESFSHRENRRWPASAVDGVLLTITAPDGTTTRFDRFGPLWTALSGGAGTSFVQSFWIDARTGPEANARRFRWMADADLTHE